MNRLIDRQCAHGAVTRSRHGLHIAASAKARTCPRENDATDRWIDFSLGQLLL